MEYPILLSLNCKFARLNNWHFFIGAGCGLSITWPKSSIKLQDKDVAQLINKNYYINLDTILVKTDHEITYDPNAKIALRDPHQINETLIADFNSHNSNVNDQLSSMMLQNNQNTKYKIQKQPSARFDFYVSDINTGNLLDIYWKTKFLFTGTIPLSLCYDKSFFSFFATAQESYTQGISSLIVSQIDPYYDLIKRGYVMKIDEKNYILSFGLSFGIAFSF